MDDHQNQGDECVFTYGTLMSEAVLRTILGRVPQQKNAVLHDHERLSIQDQIYPAVTYAPGKVVLGKVLCGVFASEVITLDAFEDPAYERCHLPVKLESGEEVYARVWVRSRNNTSDLVPIEWNFAEFQVKYEHDYLSRCEKWAKWYYYGDDHDGSGRK